LSPRALFIVALAAFIAGCPRTGPAPETQASAKAPAPLCPPAGVQAATDAFDVAEQRRTEVLERVDKYSREEPADFRRRLDADIAAIREATHAVEALSVPSCLVQARNLLELGLIRTDEALQRNGPEADPEDYRRAKDAADAVLTQYRTELALQKKNVQ